MKTLAVRTETLNSIKQLADAFGDTPVKREQLNASIIAIVLKALELDRKDDTTISH